MNAITSFDTILTADGEYYFPAVTRGIKLAVALSGTFSSATATLGFVTVTRGSATVTTTECTSDGSTPIDSDGTLVRINNAQGRAVYEMANGEDTAEIVFWDGSRWVLQIGNSETGQWSSTADVATPDLVPPGAWHATNNPNGWKPVAPATGTPVIAIAADAYTFTAIKDANGTDITATASAGWVVNVPPSGMLAVKLASVSGTCSINLTAAPAN